PSPTRRSSDLGAARRWEGDGQRRPASQETCRHSWSHAITSGRVNRWVCDLLPSASCGLQRANLVRGDVPQACRMRCSMARSAVSVADLLRASSIPALLVAMPVMAQEQPIHLPLVSLTANRVETPAAESGSAVTIIKGEELRQRQRQLVAAVLREVHGVAVSRSGGVDSTTQVYLRGSQNKQTLVLNDGIEVNVPALGSYFD